MAERERRVILTTVELRATAGAAPRVSGYAAMFNEETIIAGLFREQIAPGAFADAVKRDDVRALWNHDTNVPLGRTKSGTLTLAEDARGLKYDVQLNPDDSAAMDVRARILRGDVDGSSFGFVVEDEAWAHPAKGTNDMPLRTILKASLFDVSPVTFPAYDATSVSARSRDKAAELRATDIAALATSAQIAEREAMRARLNKAKGMAQGVAIRDGQLKNLEPLRCDSCGRLLMRIDAEALRPGKVIEIKCKCDEFTYRTGHTT